MSLRGNIKYFRPRASVRVTNPAIEVVSVEDMKAHMRLNDDTDDRYITDLIQQAREEFEDRTNIALISQTRKLVLDSWNAPPEPWWDGVREMPVTEIYSGRANSVELAVFPLISVDTVTVYDEDSNSTAVTIASVFDIDTASVPSRLTLQRGATWPIATRANNAVEIVYTVGYGTSISDVPTPLVRAIKNLVSYFYDNRGDGCSMGDAFVKSGAESIARMYRRARL